MKKPILVVLAAGMGSRYGGLKQIDPVGNFGQPILDYSIYDARRAGFSTVVFIIKHEIEEQFKEAIGNRISRVMEVRYAYQQLDILPQGYAVPEGRNKPWGTAHAILAAKDVIDAPFAVINADDYYGPDAYVQIFTYLSEHPDLAELYEYAMIGYLLRNTVTEHGSVARGVCSVDERHFLTEINERTKIEKLGENARYTEDDGATWTELSGNQPVSMNLWGFNPSILGEIERGFKDFLDQTLDTNPLKSEYFIPLIVEQLLRKKKARVKVLESSDKWFGVTYKEDKPVVVAAIRAKTEAGLYPDNLWADNLAQPRP